jgi:hypothetical protein
LIPAVRRESCQAWPGYIRFNVSNGTVELTGNWSNAHGAAHPAIYRSLVNCARLGSGSKLEPKRDIEIAVESRRGLVEQIGDRGRCFDIGDIAMHFLYAPTHSRFEAPGGRLLQMQSICAVDRNARRQFAAKGVGFPSPILHRNDNFPERGQAGAVRPHLRSECRSHHPASTMFTDDRYVGAEAHILGVVNRRRRQLQPRAQLTSRR